MCGRGARRMVSRRSDVMLWLWRVNALGILRLGGLTMMPWTMYDMWVCIYDGVDIHVLLYLLSVALRSYD